MKLSTTLQKHCPYSRTSCAQLCPPMHTHTHIHTYTLTTTSNATNQQSPGVILAVLALLCCLPFSVGRFFRDCGDLTPCCKFDDKLGKCLVSLSFGCWCYEPAEQGYTCTDKTAPCCAFLFSGIITLAVSIFAMTQVGAFSDGLTSVRGVA